MSAKGEPITRVCNFCCSGMTKARPVPKVLVLVRSQYFKSERWSGHCGASADFRLEISLKMPTEEDIDMCETCESELTVIAVRKVLMLDATEKHVADKITEAENRMKDEARQIARLHLEANFGPMLDAHMAHRRSQKKAVR